MTGTKSISRNKRALHEYKIFDRFEAGISLLGTEVKSLRQGKVNLSDGWISIQDDGKVLLNQVHITRYSHGTHENHAEQRPRPLLLRKRQIEKLRFACQAKGFAIVPLNIYFSGQWVKVEIALAKGKKDHDKRESSKDKQAQMDISRAMKNHS